MSQKGVRFNPEVNERIGKPENAYSRGTHNNKASRVEVQRELAAAGYNPYSTSGYEIARAGQFKNNYRGLANAMSRLSLHGKGRRSRRNRRSRRK